MDGLKRNVDEIIESKPNQEEFDNGYITKLELEGMKPIGSHQNHVRPIIREPKESRPLENTWRISQCNPKSSPHVSSNLTKEIRTFCYLTSHQHLPLDGNILVVPEIL